MGSIKKYLFLALTFASSFLSAQQTRPFNAFYFPTGLVVDSKDNVYVCGLNNKILKISPAGIATDFAGNPNSAVGHKDGKGTMARFDTPRQMAIDGGDTIYVTDNGSIRKVSPDGTVTTFAGYKGNVVRDGSLSQASFRRPEFIAIDHKSGAIYVTDKDLDKDGKKEFFIIRKISPSGEVSTLKGRDGNELQFDVCGLVCDEAGNIIACDMTGRCIKKISPDGSVSVIAGQCGKRFYNPVYKEGDTGNAELMTPLALTISKKGTIFFSDLRLHRIIKIENGKVTTAAGDSKIDRTHANILGYSEAGYSGGVARLALFNFPQAIAFDSLGNLFIVDQGNQCIRKLSPNGLVSTFYK